MVDQFAQRARREVLACDQGVAERGRQSDRCEVAQRIVGQRPIEPGVEREIGGACDEQGVAVGRRFRGEFRADQRPGAGAILDDDRLAECLRHFFRDDARDQIEAAARW